MKACGEPGGADQARRFFQKGVVVEDADYLALGIGDSVEGVCEQASRTRVQRERHGVDGEIAAAKVFVDGGRSDLWRLARLIVDLGAGHADLGPDISGKQGVNDLEVFIGALNDSTGTRKVLLELKRIALNREVEIANGKTANDVANGPAREVNVHIL